MYQNNRPTNQEISLKDINRIKPYLQEIHNESSSKVVETIQKLIFFYLGSPEKDGNLYQFANEFSNYEPMEWVAELEKLLEHVLPDSPVFTQLARKNKDLNCQIIISKDFLPHYIDTDTTDKTGLTNVRHTHAGLALQPLDGFYMALAYAIYNSEPNFPPATQQDHLTLDDFYTSLSRNPLLILLRKHLEYFNLRDRSIKQKIVFMIRTFLFDELLIKFEQDQNKNQFKTDPKYVNQPQSSILTFTLTNQKKSKPLKYRAKPHHFHALYLILKFAPEQLSNDFQKYSQAIIEYFPELRADQFCLQSFIRLWIYGMTERNSQNIEDEVVRVLEKANSHEGWFYLKRYSPASINTNESLNAISTQSALGIISLLEKESNWIPNPSYLWTLACFFRFLYRSRAVYEDFRNCMKDMKSDGKENSMVEKVLRLIVAKYNNSLVEILTKIKKKHPAELKESHEIMRTYKAIIEEYYLLYFSFKSHTSNRYQSPSTRSLPVEFKFKEISLNDLSSLQETTNIVPLDTIERITSENKMNLISFYRKEPRGVWEVPIQCYESTGLFYLWYTIAKIIDFVIPGKRSQPCLNIRFLASPFVMLIVILIIALTWWFIG